LDREVITPVPDALTGSKQRRGSKALSHWVRAMTNTQALEQGPAATLLSLVETQAALQGDAVALIDENSQLTYRELLERARFYAAWALNQGLGAGSVVCLMMPNCAEYVAIWLGVTHVGCVVSLINTNLATVALLHSIKISRAQHVILSASLMSRVAAIESEIPHELGLWLHDGGLSAIRMPSRAIVPATTVAAVMIRRFSSSPLGPRACRKPPMSPMRAFWNGAAGLPV
jgi:acyl-CoA synthetase (AMP-forming)/AMP-acid ligase II